MLQGLPEARNAMRSAAACGLALAVLCGASVPIFAQEDDAESAGQAAAEVAPGDYQQALAPYGAWVDDGSYGHVWQPAVGEEWQPYVDGSWGGAGGGRTGGAAGREPSATLRRRPSTGSVAAGERDGARVGAAVHRPERARSWHSPHVASGTARTRPALAVGVRSRGPGVSREPVECAGGGLATPARAGGRLRASRWHIPACSHWVPPSPHEFHAIGC